MSKKDEAVKKCLRVLEPIANERMYETQWVDSAIRACHEALEEKEWRGLSDEEIEEVYKKVSESLGKKTIYEIHTYAKAIEQKLKEKNHDTTSNQRRKETEV